MLIIVVGCGRVGIELAPALETRGHEVVVVDKDPRAFARLSEFSGRTVAGLGFDHDTLINAGIERAGALAAVTSGDNSNIVIARVARERFGLERVVARIQDPARATVYERLGITTVATVAWANDQFLRRLDHGGSNTDWLDPTGSVALIERDLPDHLAGTALIDLELDGAIRVALVSRFGSAQVMSPSLLGQAGDRLHLVVAVGAEGDVDAVLGTDEQRGSR